MTQVPARLAVVSALLALGIGCRAGGATTGPSVEAPRPPTSNQTWAGSFRFTSAVRGRFTGTTTFEGTVTLQKEQAPDPAGLPIRAGAVRYRVASGQVAVVVRLEETFVGYADVCTWVGNAGAALGPNDRVPDPELRSFLDLSDDGRYTGSLYVVVPVTQVRTCPGSVQDYPAEPFMFLPVVGSLMPGSQMRGEMAPEVVGGATNAGSWDFAPR